MVEKNLKNYKQNVFAVSGSSVPKPDLYVAGMGAPRAHLYRDTD